MSAHAHPEFARHMRQVAAILLGEPNPDCSKPDELRFGKRGSLDTGLQPDKTTKTTKTNES